MSLGMLNISETFPEFSQALQWYVRVCFPKDGAFCLVSEVLVRLSSMLLLLELSEEQKER